MPHCCRNPAKLDSLSLVVWEKVRFTVKCRAFPSNSAFPGTSDSYLVLLDIPCWLLDIEENAWCEASCELRSPLQPSLLGRLALLATSKAGFASRDKWGVGSFISFWERRAWRINSALILHINIRLTSIWIVDVFRK
jgi:hypothetical protein